MKDASEIKRNNKTPVITETSTESIKLQDKTIEEKRLNLALNLRKC